MSKKEKNLLEDLEEFNEYLESISDKDLTDIDWDEFTKRNEEAKASADVLNKNIFKFTDFVDKTKGDENVLSTEKEDMYIMLISLLATINGMLIVVLF